jgi:hypothetical protein
MKAWLGKNVNGFRILDVSYLVQDKDFEDEPQIEGCSDEKSYSCYDHSQTINHPKNYDVLKTIKNNLVADYPDW